MTKPNTTLIKTRAAWELLAEDVALLWIDSPTLNEADQQIARQLSDDFKHFSMRLDELVGMSAAPCGHNQSVCTER